jgi:competence protein ComEC
MKTFKILAFLIFLSSFFYLNALEFEENAVFVRIIDTGAGLATVAKMPGGYYMVYDTGHWDYEDDVFEALKKIIPENEEIDLLVLSHSDSDHIAATPLIFEKYRIKTILRTGAIRSSNTYKSVLKSILKHTNSGRTKDINLKQEPLYPGYIFQYGETMITFISGFHKPPNSFGNLDHSEFNNAGSIVIKLSFKGRSVLFTGDIVGRHLDSIEPTLLASEKFIVDNANNVDVKSNILIVPHHGGNNASSTAFIKAVAPEFVIFPAGSRHNHPQWSVVKRYIKYGVDENNIFRTDLGDGGGRGEWNYGYDPNQSDKVGDDDVDVLIKEDGQIVVQYRKQ